MLLSKVNKRRGGLESQGKDLASKKLPQIERCVPYAIGGVSVFG